MKTKLLLILLFLSLITEAQTNLVANGNFENWSSSSQPDNWFGYFSGEASQNATAQNGVSSVKMKILDGTINFINTGFFPVIANKTYRVTAYHKLVSGTFTSLDFSLYHKPSVFKEEIAKKTDVIFSSNAWTKIEFDYTATVSENVEVDVWTNGTLNSEILIDNVSVVDVAEIGAQYTLIPDVNFEDRLIALGIDSGVADGKVLTSKISTLTTINLYNSSISDLKGIEDFASLKDLDCRSNNLTTLDISKNINLTNLTCGDNKLKELDVSKNLNLITLDCNGNYFTSIDVTKNTALQALFVSYLANGDYSSGAGGGKIETLDLSKNLALTQLDCSQNNLKNLDVSKNLLLQYLTCNGTNLSNIDITKNIALKSLSIAYHNGGSDGLFGSFESIDLSKNTKLETLNVSYNKITSLSLSDKTELSSLKSNNNNLTTLDVSKNPKLYLLECEDNQITSLDVSKNLQLKYLKCGSNKLTSLDITQNKSLLNLYCSSNLISSLDVSNNLLLDVLNCNSNNLKTVDVSKNLVLTELACGSNQLTSLDVSNNIKLNDLYCGSNKLISLDVSKNLSLEYLGFTGNLLTSIDLSKNLTLLGVDCRNNLLTSLDISGNKTLREVNCNTNKLTYLNLKNGNSYLFVDPSYPNYKNNPDLRCIQVENVVTANANWKRFKDDTARFSEDCGAPLVLASNNFTVETKGESCQGENNGEINITATETFAYTATIGSDNYTFTNNKLAVANLAPGNYTVIIAIPGETFAQTFNLVIAKGASITGKSSVNSKKVNIEITEGTAPYTVFINGVEQFESQNSSFSVTAKGGGLLVVKTAKACEGVYTEDISGLDLTVSAYPNPTSGSFEIELPTSRKEVIIEINTLDGRFISNKKYNLENGTAKLTLENEPQGIYIATIYLDTIKSIKIIKN